MITQIDCMVLPEYLFYHRFIRSLKKITRDTIPCRLGQICKNIVCLITFPTAVCIFSSLSDPDVFPTYDIFHRRNVLCAATGENVFFQLELYFFPAANIIHLQNT